MTTSLPTQNQKIPTDHKLHYLPIYLLNVLQKGLNKTEFKDTEKGAA